MHNHPSALNSIKAQNFYSYFRDCYKQDNKEFVVENILATKYPYKWFVSGNEELVRDDLPLIPYNNKKVADLEKEMQLYQLEKKLFYGCFFILGQSENPLIKDKRICAPLLLYPANIKNNEGISYLETEAESFIINQSILSKLELKDPSLSKDLFLGELSDKLKQYNTDLIGLKSLFDKYFSNIHCDELLMYPKLWSVAKIRKHLSDTAYDSDQFKIIPAAGTVLVEKAESSLRVLNDLNALSEEGEFNASLRELLSDKAHSRHFDFSYYKSRLNTEQYKALQNAYYYNNSVIIGPPGTGKSYTITSIVADAVVNNQSVLIVSKTKQAVEVLRSMLNSHFRLKDYLIHTSGARYKFSLTTKIRNYLSGISSSGYNSINKTTVDRFNRELLELEKRFDEYVEGEMKLSDLSFSDNLGLLDKWRKFYLSSIAYDGEKIWEIFNRLQVVLSKLDKEVNLYSKLKVRNNIKENIKNYRQDIAWFYDALVASSFSEYKRLMDYVNHENVLKVFPIWLANLSDLNDVLPLQKEMFDLVIIDEATQCDIASALPAIYRAKRAVVVGDPNQLRHYSFVSRQQQANFRMSHQLPENRMFDYRNRSILDVYLSNVQSQEQVTFLREHFRSTPSLIEFSNEQFYEGQLKVLKSTPKHTTHKQIEVFDVDGQRDGKGINAIEANEVIKQLNKLIAKHKEDDTPPSIGIVSPFSSQVNFINKLLREKYDLKELKQFDILCGTPYHFQGSERDFIILSFGVCPNTHPSAFIHLNKPEVFNVGITRAKSYQIIIKSLEVSVLKKDSLLYKYLRFIDDFTHAPKEEIEADEFQTEVLKELNKLKFDSIKTAYPLAGSLLDILISHNNNNYFIDLIGYPGMFKEAFTFERYKTLGRTGVKTFPLHYSYWQKNKVNAINRIKRLIK